MMLAFLTILTGGHITFCFKYSKKIGKRAKSGFKANIGNRKTVCQKCFGIINAKRRHFLDIGLPCELSEQFAEIGWTIPGYV